MIGHGWFVDEDTGEVHRCDESAIFDSDRHAQDYIRGLRSEVLGVIGVVVVIVEDGEIGPVLHCSNRDEAAGVIRGLRVHWDRYDVTNVR